MTRANIEAMPAAERSTRLWMILAFIAGIVFTAVLAQTLAAANIAVPAAPGEHDSLTPVAFPGEGYLVINLNTTFHS